MLSNIMIISYDDPILITGANGFIGSRVVERLLDSGFRNLRCFVRPSSNLDALEKIVKSHQGANLAIMKGNLLSRDDCEKAAQGAKVIYHLAAGIEKSFPGSYMNSVVTTRNLLDAVVKEGVMKRFVNISSFAVYSNWNMKHGALLDENCELESHHVERYDAYAFAKAKQDELLLDYAKRYGIPYVILRPGQVFGPGKKGLTGRIGIDTFGLFLHLGGSNRIPFTYVDNCAEAIVLAGSRKGVDGEIFNVIDDDIPTSRKFLKMYKKHVRNFPSIYVPYRLFYLFCSAWERYAAYSDGQLPPAFNRRKCSVSWKGNRYSNEKLKKHLGWNPTVPFEEAARRYFDGERKNGAHHA